MEIRVWRSFSCNNSNSYYLVGRFASAAAAQEAAASLPEQFEALDELEETPWMEGEHPDYWVEGSTVVVYHGYCGGLHDVHLPGALSTDLEDSSAPMLAVLALADGERGKELIAQLSAYFAQGTTTPGTDDWNMAPWGEELRYSIFGTDSLWWTDGSALAFRVPFDWEPARVRGYLERAGAKSIVIELCDEPLSSAIRTLVDSKNLCPECKSDQVKLVGFEAGIEEAQLVCSGCGGMFTLATVQMLAPVVRLGEQRLTKVAVVDERVFVTTEGGSIWRRSHGRGWENVHRMRGSLYGIAAAEDRVVAVGWTGVVATSTDGGDTWMEVKVGDAQLYAVTCAPSGTWFAGGAKGTLLRSKNGADWESLEPPKPATLGRDTSDVLAIAAVSDERIYAGARNGRIFVSDDGGNHWARAESPTEKAVCRIVPTGVGLGAVAVGDRALVLHTEDGLRWSELQRASSGDLEDVVRCGVRYFAASSSGEVVVFERNLSRGARAAGVGSLWGIAALGDDRLIAVGDDGFAVTLEME